MAQRCQHKKYPEFLAINMLRERFRLRIINLNYLLKRRRDAKNKTTWEAFEQRVGLKRTGGDKDGQRSTRNAPTNILVQHMSSTASSSKKI